MSRSFRNHASVVSQPSVGIAGALTIYSHLKCALSVARGAPKTQCESDWDADAKDLLQIAADLKLDQRQVLLHTCADLAVQIERSLSLSQCK